MDLKEEKGEEIHHHVLLVALSAQGHLNPMLRLGKRLLSKGLHVTLATTESTRHLLLKSSSSTAAAAAAQSVSGITLDFFSDGLSLDFDRKNNLNTFVDSLRKVGPTNLSDLIRRRFHGPHKLSCIVGNPFVPWVAAVAAQHDIPAAALWIQPCTLYTLYYHFYNNLNKFPSHSNPHMSVELPGLPLFRPEDLPSFVLPSNPVSGISELLSEFFESIEKYKWVLANSFEELEKDAIESMSTLRPVAPVGPLVPKILLGEKEEENRDNDIEMWKPEDKCVEWLSRQPPSSVVYVSFGSLSTLSAKQMENIATALENSNRPFLWVVKPPEYPSPDGEGEVPPGFEEGTEGRGLVVAWCQQAEVLAHPAVGCFVTHCGWNSTLEAVAAGVPLVAFPQWSDQPTNAKMVTEGLEVGVRLRSEGDGVVKSEEVERCIEEVMGGERAAKYMKKAEELKEAARKALVQGGSSDRNMHLFVDGIVGKLS